MARELRLDVNSDASGARRGLDSAADGVDHLRRETNRLEHEFQQASRAAAGLDRQLLETKAATRALAAEFARTKDVGVGAKLDQQKAELRELTKMRQDVFGGVDKEAAKARSAFEKAFKSFNEERRKFNEDRRDKGFFGFFANAAEAGAKAGIEAGNGFMGAISGVFKSLPPEAQAGIVAGLLTAVAAAAPVIASAINAAVLLGVGGGGLAAGIAIAARSDQVKSAFRDFGELAMAGLTSAASPFVSELVAAAGIFKGAFTGILPDIRGIFSALSETVQPLARGLGGLAREALPGIRRAAEAAVPLFNALADELPGLGAAVSDFFSSVAEGAPGAIAFMKEFLATTEDTLRGFGAWLAEYGQVLAGAAAIADALGLTSNKTEAFGRVLNLNKSGIDSWTSSARSASTQVRILADELDKAFNKTMDAITADLNFRDALDHLKETLRDHRNQWNANTEAGRENIRATQEAIQAAYAKMQADIASGRSAAAARDEFRKATEAILAQASAAGATDAQIRQLTADWKAFLETPGVKDLTIRVHQVGSVSSQGVISGGDPRRSVGKAYATGTMSAAPGLALVHKDELIDFRGGERVYNKRDTAKILRGMGLPSVSGMVDMAGSNRGGSNNVTVTLRVAGGADSALASLLMKMERTGQLTWSAA